MEDHNGDVNVRPYMPLHPSCVSAERSAVEIRSGTRKGVSIVVA